MNKHPIYSSDLDSYNQTDNNTNGEPSAPPSIQNQQYETILITVPSSPLLTVDTNYRYVIRKRGENDQHFPINAAIFLLSLLQV